MKRYAKLYFKFLQQYIKSLMEYRTDFIIGLIGFVLVQGTGVIFLKLIFNTIPSLVGWSFYEILFIYGFAQIPRGIDHIFTDYIWIFSWKTIVKGEFDRYLLRPVNPLFQIIAERFQPDGFGEIIVGILLVSFSSIKLGINYTVSKLIAFIFAIICGAVIYTAIKLAVASTAFWIKNAMPYMNMVYSISDFSKYPIEIYNNSIKNFLTFFIPFAFTGFYPAAYFLGKNSFNKGIIMTFIIAVVSITIAYRIWLKGISIYESSGN